jgi:alpha/beta superfamily hydrolase
MVLAYSVASGFGARSAMTIERVPLQTSPEAFGLVYQDISFTSRSDGLLLKGWLMPSVKDQIIIVVNGGYQNRIDDSDATLGMTTGLVASGYNVLLFDLRGRGESTGTGHSLCNAEEDIGGAVDYVKSCGYRGDDICIMGFCSGAVLSCYFASQNDIGALVLDGCFARVSTMVIREAQDVGVPAFLASIFLPGLHVMSYLIYDFRVVDPLDRVADIPCPVFFIHEENDAFTTIEETYELYRASGNHKSQIWEIKGTEHSLGYLSGPEEYIEKVTGFLERVM